VSQLHIGSKLPEEPNILVVGAGPTGLTAAIELARRDIKVHIIDRKEGPTSLSKAVGISAHSLEILEPSGVAAQLLARGIRIRRANIWSPAGRRLGRIDFSQIRHRYNFLLSLPQSETETILGGALGRFGVAVEWQAGLAGLAAAGGVIRASIGGKADQAYDYVFGADGVHSRVRESLGLAFPGKTHKRLWSIADVEGPDWPYDPGEAHLFLRPAGSVCFAIPIGKQRFRAVSNTPDAMVSLPSSDRMSRVLQTDTFHIPVKQAPAYQSGNVFLGGDAAHVHSPVGGRGMNLGIEDAAGFARRFFSNNLAGYTAERHPIGKTWIELSEKILAGAQAQSLLGRTARDLAIFALGHAPILQRPMLRRVSGLEE
jgi:2-polyprenyl-6-methoxyphenol hydroxylase-like FAD-dependent oxidoreductase